MWNNLTIKENQIYHEGGVNNNVLLEKSNISDSKKINKTNISFILIKCVFIINLKESQILVKNRFENIWLI